ncbi:hypothetical protein [Aurantiacibacter spongiae]|uniref:Lipoprotein n=1 Tax=Aurantiacibacter spongiae TaxID=2488860 RepID=A0A3N5CIN1_9SPHN|nr:hypothetical protein [Aurantiacibacter spongiae]RPF68833.1 hypothetical protein EG799_13835 [Aurantiacibacter spongiae]
MRACALLAATALAGCGAGDAKPPGQIIECALEGAGSFAPDCTMQRGEGRGTDVLIVRHPDGSFRRFELGVPGRGIVTADGMEQAEVERGEGLVELRVGSDRYRIPVAR